VGTRHWARGILLKREEFKAGGPIFKAGSFFRGFAPSGRFP
jgi:hypothetical protein